MKNTKSHVESAGASRYGKEPSDWEADLVYGHAQGACPPAADIDC